MSANAAAMSNHEPLLAVPGAAGTAPGEQIQLDLPPQNVRITFGSVTIDISWGGQPPASAAVPDGQDRPDGQYRPQAPPGQDGQGALPEVPGGGRLLPRRGTRGRAVSVGSDVRPGQQVGIIEAMKLMIPVEADRPGRITAVVAGNGEPVEYDEPLFAIESQEA